jgi:RNA polymerase sigma factor (sigma-70 family)
MKELNITDIYVKYWDKMLYQVCWNYTKNADEAKDLCQNGFLKVNDNLHKYKEIGSLEGWIRKIIKNSILDYQRKKKLPVTLEIPWEIISDTTPIENTPINKDIYNISDIIRVKDKLPNQKLKVFNMVLDGYKHKEIADELGISEGTSKSTFHRAKKSLRKILLTKNNIE